MENANMLMLHTLQNKWTVSEFNGQRRALPIRDALQNLRNIKVNVTRSSEKNAKQVTKGAFTRSLKKQSDNDFDLPLGEAGVIWAFGGYGFTDGTTKHLQGSKTHYYTFIEMCKAPTTTTTTSTTTTRTSTTSTTITSTTSTTTTHTSTTTTTTLERAPNRKPLGPKPYDKLGYISIKSNILIDPEGVPTHEHEQGLQAFYYDYAKSPNGPQREHSSYYCARRSRRHAAGADVTGTVPAINYPPHVQHNLGSNFTENFCSAFKGWVQIPVTGNYQIKASCSLGDAMRTCPSPCSAAHVL